MRGKFDARTAMFFAINLEELVRPSHPLRPIKRIVDQILKELAATFDAAYSTTGRPSVPPERLLKALLLQCLYSVRSEAQLVERLDTDLLFRWFCDMDPAEPIFDATAFTHNRQRLATHGIAAAFFERVVRRKDWPALMARLRMRARLKDAGYAVSQRCRKLVEESFGWTKTVAGLVWTRLVGRWKITQQMHLAAAAFNLVRLRKLLPG